MEDGVFLLAAHFAGGDDFEHQDDSCFACVGDKLRAALAGFMSEGKLSRQV